MATTNTGMDIKPPTQLRYIRSLQTLVGGAVLGLSAWLIHGAVTDEQSFSLVCGLFTVMIGVFAAVARRHASLRASLTPLLLLVTADAVMVVFWLSAMSSSAALRSRLDVPVYVSGCYNDGGAFNSEHCFRKREDSPFLVAGPGALDMIAAIAGLSALEMILFVASMVLTFTHYRARSAVAAAAAAEELAVEPKHDGSQILPGTYIVQEAQGQQYVVMQQQQQQPPPVYGTPSPLYGVGQPQTMYPVPPQQTMSPPPGQYHQQQQFQQQVVSPVVGAGTPAPYEMAGTPAPGMQYPQGGGYHQGP